MGKGRDLSIFTDEVVDQIFARDKGKCAKCGRKWDRDYGRGELGGWDMQHRMARGMGGGRRNPVLGSVTNGIVLCRGCHNDVERKFRVDGFSLGFVISRNGIRTPDEVPIRHAAHGWVLLTQEGGVVRCQDPTTTD